MKSIGPGIAQTEFAFPIIRIDRLERALSQAARNDEQMRQLKDEEEERVDQYDKAAPTQPSQPHEQPTTERRT